MLVCSDGGSAVRPVWPVNGWRRIGNLEQVRFLHVSTLDAPGGIAYCPDGHSQTGQYGLTAAPQEKAVCTIMQALYMMQDQSIQTLQ